MTAAIVRIITDIITDIIGGGKLKVGQLRARHLIDMWHAMTVRNVLARGVGQ